MNAVRLAALLTLLSSSPALADSVKTALLDGQPALSFKLLKGLTGAEQFGDQHQIILAVDEHEVRLKADTATRSGSIPTVFNGELYVPLDALAELGFQVAGTAASGNVVRNGAVVFSYEAGPTRIFSRSRLAQEQKEWLGVLARGITLDGKPALPVNDLVVRSPHLRWAEGSGQLTNGTAVVGKLFGSGNVGGIVRANGEYFASLEAVSRAGYPNIYKNGRLTITVEGVPVQVDETNVSNRPRHTTEALKTAHLQALKREAAARAAQREAELKREEARRRQRAAYLADLRSTLKRFYSRHGRVDVVALNDSTYAVYPVILGSMDEGAIIIRAPTIEPRDWRNCYYIPDHSYLIRSIEPYDNRALVNLHSAVTGNTVRDLVSYLGGTAATEKLMPPCGVSKVK